MRTKHLVISMHDVTPAHDKAVRTCMDMLDELDIPCSNLLVVPCYHDTELESSPEFCHWLLDRQQRGDELVLHGFRHKISRKPRKIMKWINCSLFSRMECEFLDIDSKQCAQLISQGLERFKRTGISVNGFVPPSWLIDQANLPVLHEHGLQWVTRQPSLIDLKNNISYFSPAVLLWGGTTAMNKLSRFYMQLMLPLIRNLDLVRIVLHPADVYSGALDWYRKIISKTLKTHTPTTYGEFIRLHS